MRKIITSLFIGLSFISFGQNEMFQQKMGEALQAFGQSKTAVDYAKAAQKFNEIAQVETENWLPAYYEVMSYTMAGFSRQITADEKDAYLDMAKPTMENLKKLAPHESEIFALESMFVTARLVVNPMERGQSMTALSIGAAERALALNPNNPRAKYMKLSNQMGTAQFFGKDVAPFCQTASTIYAEWDNFELKSPFHPSWGKDEVEEIIKNCGAKKEEGSIQKEENKSSGLSLQVHVQKLKSSEGLVLMQLKNEKEEVIQTKSVAIENGNALVSFTNLPEGKYAVSYFHDANSNMKLDSGKYGPTEGYGFSNNAKGFMNAPDFSKTLFLLNSDVTLSLKTRN